MLRFRRKRVHFVEADEDLPLRRQIFSIMSLMAPYRVTWFMAEGVGKVMKSSLFPQHVDECGVVDHREKDEPVLRDWDAALS